MKDDDLEHIIEITFLLRKQQTYLYIFYSNMIIKKVYCYKNVFISCVFFLYVPLLPSLRNFVHCRSNCVKIFGRIFF